MSEQTNAPSVVNPPVIVATRKFGEEEVNYNFILTTLKPKDKSKPARTVYVPEKPTAETDSLLYQFSGPEMVRSAVWQLIKRLAVNFSASATKDGVINIPTLLKYLADMSARMDTIKSLTAKVELHMGQLVSIVMKGEYTDENGTVVKLAAEEREAKQKEIAEIIAETNELIKSKRQTSDDDDDEEEEEASTTEASVPAA